MKTSYSGTIAALIISLSLCAGCFLSTQENLEKLPDKKFYFTEFQFILPGQSKESAYKFFREFPVKKVMFMLAKEYNLTIDIADFGNFIRSKKASVIETEGLLRIAKHTWKKKNTENNSIVFIFEQDYMDSSVIKFSIGIYKGKTLLKKMNTDINKIDAIFNQLTYFLKSAEQSIKEFDSKNYAKVTPVPMIIEATGEIPAAEEPATISKIKSMIDEYVKTLDDEKKKEFKHDIIDFIYQKCN
jgi:hypothetical protein